MSVLRKTWCWRRWIVAGREDLWTARLQTSGCVSWAFLERSKRSRILLEAYVASRAAGLSLHREWGGEVRAMDADAWLKPHNAAPTRIGDHLEIIHGPAKKAHVKRATKCLYVPHGVAFGSGEHATTYMLLQALVRQGDWSRMAVLDLGTGSGILALTARLLDARYIVATDFDADAVRTARQNEALNFSEPLIRWRCADVKRLRATGRYGLVLANLFSGILGEAAPQIAGSISPNGQLWLSGILRSQKDEVMAAYRAQKLRIIHATSRGKWVMLQFCRRA